MEFAIVFVDLKNKMKVFFPELLQTCPLSSGTNSLLKFLSEESADFKHGPRGGLRTQRRHFGTQWTLHWGIEGEADLEMECLDVDLPKSWGISKQNTLTFLLAPSPENSIHIRLRRYY